jgi:hypothetical protein
MHHHMKIEQLNEQWQRELIDRILSRVPRRGIIGVVFYVSSAFMSASPLSLESAALKKPPDGLMIRPAA